MTVITARGQAWRWPRILAAGEGDERAEQCAAEEADEVAHCGIWDSESRIGTTMLTQRPASSKWPRLIQRVEP